MSGRIIARRYRLLEVIGRGGHSVIYRAADLHLLMEVAIKILHDAHLRDPTFVTRIEREYDVLRSLEGTAAPRVFDLCRDGDDTCLVMELLRGKDLDDHLSALESGGERLGVGELVHYLEPIVSTLELAHERGIVHRDLKPGNIFILDDDAIGVRLLDFGLSAVRTARPITRDGMVIGSPSYIAPEVWSGNPRALDLRVDVYALGAVVYRALAGRVPFPATSIRKKLELTTSGERPSLHEYRPEVPVGVDAWIRQALAVDPNERFSSVRGMWAALMDVLDVPGGSSRLPSADVG